MPSSASCRHQRTCNRNNIIWITESKLDRSHGRTWHHQAHSNNRASTARMEEEWPLVVDVNDGFVSNILVNIGRELATEIDSLGQKHDLLQRDLTEHNAADALVSRVNDWEQTSIAKIRLAAEQARTDIREHLDRHKQQLQSSLHRVSDDLRAGCQSDDYTETDLKKWLTQMQEIRALLEKSSSVCIIDANDSHSIVHLIQVKQGEATGRTESGMHRGQSSTENTLHSTEKAPQSVSMKNPKDSHSSTQQSTSICQKCGQKFAINANDGGGCVHSGIWHAKYDDCSYLKCGFHLGMKASIGQQHWSCCYSLERESNKCRQSGPHAAALLF